MPTPMERAALVGKVTWGITKTIVSRGMMAKAMREMAARTTWETDGKSNHEKENHGGTRDTMPKRVVRVTGHRTRRQCHR